MLLDLSKILLVVLLCIQIGCEAAAAGKGKSGNMEAMITKKLKNATPAQIQKYKMDAAKKMSGDLGKTMQVLSTNKEVPADVRAKSKTVLQGLKSGKLNPALAKSMPMILQKAGPQQGNPGQQLQTVLASVIPNAPADLKGSLNGVVTFVQANVGGVTNLLGKVTGGVPDLLMGTVKSLSSTLGGVNEAINGSVGSLGPLLGGLLAATGTG